MVLKMSLYMGLREWRQPADRQRGANICHQSMFNGQNLPEKRVGHFLAGQARKMGVQVTTTVSGMMGSMALILIMAIVGAAVAVAEMPRRIRWGMWWPVGDTQNGVKCSRLNLPPRRHHRGTVRMKGSTQESQMGERQKRTKAIRRIFPPKSKRWTKTIYVKGKHILESFQLLCWMTKTKAMQIPESVEMLRCAAPDRSRLGILPTNPKNDTSAALGNQLRGQGGGSGDGSHLQDKGGGSRDGSHLQEKGGGSRDGSHLRDQAGGSGTGGNVVSEIVGGETAGKGSPATAK